MCKMKHKDQDFFSTICKSYCKRDFLGLSRLLTLKKTPRPSLKKKVFLPGDFTCC